MRLLTNELEKRFAEVGSQKNVKDPVIIAKFFLYDPGGDDFLYATEYDPKNKLFFGYVSLSGGWIEQWKHLSLVEMESFKNSLGIGFKRDLHFREQKISSIIR